MVYIKWKIDYVPFESGAWNESKRETLEGFRMPMIRRFLGNAKDSFDFKLTNINGKYDGKFNVNDKIYIYKAVNTETIPSDPLMVGTVRDGTFGDNFDSDIITVKGYNFSESVMNAIVFIDAQTLDIPEAIEQALLDMGEQNKLFKVTWASTNPSVRSDSSAFPGVNEKFYYKPIRNLIEKYSTNYSTGDGNYYWYVNKDNEMIWKQGSEYDSSTFNSDTDLFIAQKIGKDLSGIINFVIMKGGIDPKGSQIQTPFVHSKSVAKVGYKFKVIVSENNAAKILLDGDLSQSYGADKQATANVYPQEIEDGTSFTTSWVATGTYTTSKYSISVTAGSNITINEGTAAGNKNAYVELIRTEVKLRLKAEAQRITEDLQYGKLKYDIDVQPGTYSWGLGDRIKVTNPKIKNGIETELRVMEIQDTEGGVKYSMEEDIGTLGN